MNWRGRKLRFHNIDVNAIIAAWYASKWCTAPPGTRYGGDQDYWSPRKSGVNFDLSYSLELLHASREYLTIVGNTDARPAAEAQAPRKVYDYSVRKPSVAGRAQNEMAFESENRLVGCDVCSGGFLQLGQRAAKERRRCGNRCR